MLHEINELTGKLEGPVKRASRMIHVQFHCEVKKTFETLTIDISALQIVRKEDTKSEHVCHLRVMHLHVWPKLATRGVWIIRCEAVDDVIGLRSVWHNSLSIEKIAPLDDDLLNSTVACEGPIMKQGIQ